jgi:hypothetical protein
MLADILVAIAVDGRGSMSPGAGKQISCFSFYGNGIPTHWTLLCVYLIIGYESASYAGHANMGRPDSRSVASAGELGMDQKAFEAEANSTGAIPAQANEAPDLLW